MGYGRRRLFRNLWGSVGVAGILAVIGLGLPALDQQVPAALPVSDTQPYLVGAGVTVIPPAGTTLDATKTSPGSLNGEALFYVGNLRYVIVVSHFDGTLSQAATRLREKITQTRGYQVTGPESPIVTHDGVIGRQGTYASPGKVGRYAVFIQHDVDVEVTVAGTDVDLRPRIAAIGASVATIAFGAT